LHAPKRTPLPARAPAASADDELEGALQGLEEPLEELAHSRIPTQAIWVPSFVALGVADVASSTRGLAVSSKAVDFLGVAGGFGLMAASVQDFRHAKTLEQQLDAANDFAWGGQGLLYLGTSKAAAGASLGFGIVGGMAQSWVGARRVMQGLQKGDGGLTKLGALDLGGGLLWLTWDIVGMGTPVFVAGYVVLMLGREAYANRREIQGAGRKLAQRVQRSRFVREWRTALERRSRDDGSELELAGALELAQGR
jgi:hypothetical protein